MYKNIEKQMKLQLKEQVAYQPGQVVSKTLVQNDKVSMTLFSFDKGEEISTHAAGGDAMVPTRSMAKNNLKCSLSFHFDAVMKTIVQDTLSVFCKSYD